MLPSTPRQPTSVAAPKCAPELLRSVSNVQRHKRLWAGGLTILSLLLPVAWTLWLACYLGFWLAFLGLQWQAFNVAVARYRLRGTIFVVHVNNDIAKQRANAVKAEIERLGSSSRRITLVCSEDFDPWILLSGSHTLVFVTGDPGCDSSERVQLEAKASVSAGAEVEALDRLFLWLLNEKATRLSSSAFSGWNTNIVYTAEGNRRTSFQRLNYAVIPCHSSKNAAEHPQLCCAVGPQRLRSPGTVAPPVSRQVDGYLEAFGARRVCADAASLLAASEPRTQSLDFPQLGTFWAWAMGCPCCDQIIVERSRHRPSPFRVPLWRQLTLWFYDPSMRAQLRRHYKAVFEGAWNSVQTVVKTPLKAPARITFLEHPVPTPVSPVQSFQWDCAFGDPELVEQSALPSDCHNWTVNPDFIVIEGVGRAAPNDVEYEFAAPFPGSQLCVRHPGTGAYAVYQILDDQYRTLLQDLRSRTDIADLSPLLRSWLIETHLWVDPGMAERFSQRTKAAKEQLDTQGWTVFDAHTLIPAPFLRALRRFYRNMEPHLFEHSFGACQRTYNDEPVARQIQQSLTEWIQRLMGEPLTHSSLALSIFIQAGPGFIYHQDTSPPFDLTLDLVVDHEGPSTRPLFFTRPSKGLVPLVEKLELKMGEAVLFRGSELTHWGGDMPAGQHKVILGTWQYLRD